MMQTIKKLKHNLFLYIDLYTFDKNEELAKETYEKVCQAYENLFQLLELPIIKSKKINWNFLYYTKKLDR